MNVLRLEKLKVKIECVNSVFDDVRQGLINKIKNKPDDYKIILKDLIMQGLFKLLEENVQIICKECDYQTVITVKEEAKKGFLALLAKESDMFKNFNVNITVDTKYYLPKEL
jgi:V-type H+-transporting ATPase subunit E